MLLRFFLRQVPFFENVLRALFRLNPGQMTATKALDLTPNSSNFLGIKNTTRLRAVIICMVDELS
jgi:hypothetical protein